jgi:hypothetical protein
MLTNERGDQFIKPDALSRIIRARSGYASGAAIVAPT